MTSPPPIKNQRSAPTVKKSTSSPATKADTKGASTGSISRPQKASARRNHPDRLSREELDAIKHKADITKVISDNGREREAAYDMLRLIKHIEVIS